jgi:3-dehydroquinate dehydratase/shikimate dehydrogenase
MASLIATLFEPPSADGAELTALPASVEWLEVRADRVGDIDPEWLRDHFKGRLLYSFRSEDLNRSERLKNAAQFYDRIELEVETDATEELLGVVPVEKRLLSWYGRVSDLSQLNDRFTHVSSVPASAYKIVTTAGTITEEFLPLSLLKSLNRTDTIAFSIGPLGFWNRLVALHLGAPAIYGLVTGGSAADMEPSIGKLIADYGLPEVSPANELFAIIGSPIFHSLSPRLHNTSYRALNHAALFVPLRVDSFADFWREFVTSRKLDEFGMPINGMTVASPHKEEAVLTAKTISGMVRQTEAANILVRNNGWWTADTTDPDVVYSVSVKEKRAAVIGCGGAGRAIAAALVQSGAGVTLINRGAERGEHAEAPFEVERLNHEAVVIDLVYGSRPTPLVGTTRARQQLAIDGRDVLVTQVSRQFRLMTGKEMPIPQIMKIL